MFRKTVIAAVVSTVLVAGTGAGTALARRHHGAHAGSGGTTNVIKNSGNGGAGGAGGAGGNGGSAGNTF
jgi:hypothetical protein